FAAAGRQDLAAQGAIGEGKRPEEVEVEGLVEELLRFGELPGAGRLTDRRFGGGELAAARGVERVERLGEEELEPALAAVGADQDPHVARLDVSHGAVEGRLGV